jgi:MFS transporter, PHS family, inorganic phosphate transporter
MPRWLIGASLAWLLFAFVYYGNTISRKVIVGLVAPRASLLGQIVYTLAIFAVAALPGYFLAAATIDRIGRKFLQGFGFAVMAAACGGLWLVPGATKAVGWFMAAFSREEKAAFPMGAATKGIARPVPKPHSP